MSHQPPTRRGFYRRHDALIVGTLSVAAALAVWQAFWSAGLISPLFFSGPSAIAVRFYDVLVNGTLLADIAYSGRNFAVGFALALAAGVLLGLLLGWYRLPRLIVEPFLNGLYATPRIALIPLIIIWFGIGPWSKVFIVFVSAFFPILINTIAGVKAIDADLLIAARAFCATDRQIFATVALPGAVPFILAGVRQGVAHGLIGVVVGELFAGSEGIGFMISYAGQNFATDLLFVGVLVIACAGIVLTSLAERVQRRFSRWRPHN
jgi:NitT/TauT family transport system permease protein